MTDLVAEPVDLDAVEDGGAQHDAPGGLDAVDEQLIAQLADRARAGGLDLTGENGLLAQLTKRVLESALEGEITDHLGYEAHDPAGRDGGNSRNGHRAKTVLTEAGPVEIDVPRDRDGSFTPTIVAKRRRRLSGVDARVLLVAAGAAAGWPDGLVSRLRVRPFVVLVHARLTVRAYPSGVTVVMTEQLLRALAALPAALSPHDVDVVFDVARRSTTWNPPGPPAGASG